MVMKKIRSGQSFLYRENGYNSTVLEFRMADRVRGDCLQAALGKTVNRMPDMTCKLVEKAGSYYLQHDEVSMNAVPTAKLRTLGAMQTGYHLLDVTFHSSLIRVSFHHALCDGGGAKQFAETLIYYYCSLRYVKPGRNRPLDFSGIRTLESPIDPNETAEPLGTDPFDVAGAKQTRGIEIIKDGYALPESTDTPTVCRRTGVEIGQDIFVALAKRFGATPGLMATILISRAILRVHPDADKPVVCSMAADLRSSIGMEATRRNLTGSFYFPYGEMQAHNEIAHVAARYRELLAAQRSPDAIHEALNMQIGLFNKLDSIPTLEGKRHMMAMFDHLLINTYVLSYLGRMRFNDFAQYVHSVHLYSGDIKGLSVNMVAAGDVISFDILQGFDGDAYANAFLAELDYFGIPYITTDTFEFETGGDKSHITASRQAERYFTPVED